MSLVCSIPDPVQFVFYFRISQRGHDDGISVDLLVSLCIAGIVFDSTRQATIPTGMDMDAQRRQLTTSF